MATKPEISLIPVEFDKDSISSVARTVNLAFSPDPLMQWLRPISQNAACKWQRRRTQRAKLRGLVFQSLPVKHIAQILPAKINNSSGSDSVVDTINSTLEAISGRAGLDSGVVVFLSPPREDRKWSVQKLLQACQLWVLDKTSPIPDIDISKERQERMSQAHEASVKLLKSKYHLKKLWYLEILAVHPLLQSRGLGGNVLRWILEYIGNAPIFLECARRENIGFYESHGFEVVEKVELADDEIFGTGERVYYWVMVRR